MTDDYTFVENRHICLSNHAAMVRRGLFHGARLLLRNALRWKGGKRSEIWEYPIYKGRLFPVLVSRNYD